MDGFDPRNLLQIPVFLFSLTVHEWAHAWTAKKGGDMTAAYLGRLSLNPIVHIDPIGTILLPLVCLFTGAPFFGWAKPVPVQEMKFRRSDWIVVVALAGPLSNVFIAAIVAFIMKASFMIGGANIPDTSLVEVLYLLGLMFMQINLVLAIFNMLPIPPLDGSKLIYQYFIKSNWNLMPLWMFLNQAGFLLVYVLFMFPPVKNGFSLLFSTLMSAVLGWISAGA